MKNKVPNLFDSRYGNKAVKLLEVEEGHKPPVHLEITDTLE